MADSAAAAKTLEEEHPAEDFTPLDFDMNTKALLSRSEHQANHDRNSKLGLPPFEKIQHFGRSRGKKDIAIVAGGPSVKDYLWEISKSDYIMSCGSAHDFLFHQGLHVDFAVFCDAADDTEFATVKSMTTAYLLATTANQKLFDTLIGRNNIIYTWQCAGEADFSEGTIGICGGCSTVLRAWTLAIMLGFHNLRFFGVDSSYADDGVSHGYDHGQYVPKEDIPVEIKSPDGKKRRVFRTIPAWLAQAQQFQNMMDNYAPLCKTEVFGTGLLPTMWKMKEDSHPYG